MDFHDIAICVVDIILTVRLFEIHEVSCQKRLLRIEVHLRHRLILILVLDKIFLRLVSMSLWKQSVPDVVIVTSIAIEIDEGQKIVAFLILT